MIYTVMLSIYFVQHTVKYMELNIFNVLFLYKTIIKHRLNKPMFRAALSDWGCSSSFIIG